MKKLLNKAARNCPTSPSNFIANGQILSVNPLRSNGRTVILEKCSTSKVGRMDTRISQFDAINNFFMILFFLFNSFLILNYHNWICSSSLIRFSWFDGDCAYEVTGGWHTVCSIACAFSWRTGMNSFVDSSPSSIDEIVALSLGTSNAERGQIHILVYIWNYFSEKQ